MGTCGSVARQFCIDVHPVGKVREPLSRNQIAELLDWSFERASHILKSLIDHNEIQFIEFNRHQAAEKLGLPHPTRRMRFYFVE